MNGCKEEKSAVVTYSRSIAFLTKRYRRIENGAGIEYWGFFAGLVIVRIEGNKLILVA